MTMLFSSFTKTAPRGQNVKNCAPARQRRFHWTVLKSFFHKTQLADLERQYILFCQVPEISSKQIKIFLFNKARVTKAIKDLIWCVLIKV